jgi:hypothetical protein
MRLRLLLVSASLCVVPFLAEPAVAAINPQTAGLQVALRSWGFYGGPIDGIAGPQTALGVRAFQHRMQLRVDGIPGRVTRSALGRLGRPLYGRRPIQRRMVGWDVSVLQFMLTRRRAPTGIIDGYFGPETARALRRFQRRVGVGVDAVAGPVTRRALDRGVAARRSHSSRPSRRTVKATINYWARRNGVNPSLARALASVKSGFRPHLVSSAGARGVMQVTPSTWRYVENVLIGRRVERTWAGNIRVGVRYLDYLLGSFNGRRRLALAAYNQGEWSVRQRGVDREARRFAANVLALVGRV